MFRSSRPRRGLRATATLAAAVVTAGLLAPGAQAADHPGNFTGFGFDQCEAPSQSSMDAWMESSPFLAVGIYVSGDSRACQAQVNLSPEWLKTQRARGWQLLPIALGPQASCHPAFPRYEGDAVINPAPGTDGRYAAAKAQGRKEAVKNVRDAAALGITKKSILWYDLEHFDITDVHCRESALAFMSSWNAKVSSLGYVSGMYGGASSSLRMFDDARVERPGKFTLPTYIWIARWDGRANTSAAPFLREDGWKGRRMKQYIGDHLETHGGVTINIDSNYLDLGKGSRTTTNTRCGAKGRTSLSPYLAITSKKKTQTKKRVKAVQCLLRERGYTSFKVTGRYGPSTQAAVRKFRKSQGLPASAVVTRTTWIRLLSTGKTPTVKVGSQGRAVHRLQQSLTAAGVRKGYSNGLFDAETRKQVRAYQRKVKLPANGVAGITTWAKLRAGQTKA